jgi:hypothetical protein
LRPRNLTAFQVRCRFDPATRLFQIRCRYCDSNRVGVWSSFETLALHCATELLSSSLREVSCSDWLAVDTEDGAATKFARWLDLELIREGLVANQGLEGPRGLPDVVAPGSERHDWLGSRLAGLVCREAVRATPWLGAARERGSNEGERDSELQVPQGAPRRSHQKDTPPSSKPSNRFLLAEGRHALAASSTPTSFAASGETPLSAIHPVRPAVKLCTGNLRPAPSRTSEDPKVTDTGKAAAWLQRPVVPSARQLRNVNTLHSSSARPRASRRTKRGQSGNHRTRRP